MDTLGHGSIYALLDPRDRTRRYVGETTLTLPQRVGLHVAGCLNHSMRGDGARLRVNQPFIDWISELQQLGMMPLIVLLETVEQTGDEKLDKRHRWERERYWKHQLCSEGCSLLNGTPGVRKGHKFAEGVGPNRLKGRKRPELAAKLTGRIVSEEVKASLKVANQARWDRDRASGKLDDPEFKARRKAAAKLAWETRRANAAAKP